MRLVFKIVKAFAIVLAVLIILTIGAGALTGFSFLGMIGEGTLWNGGSTQETVSENYGSVKSLEVSVKATNVFVREATDGEAVRVETNNEDVVSWVDGNTLNVIEKSHGILGWGGTGELTIYVRKGVTLDDVKLTIGAGQLEIRMLRAKRLTLDLGAGKTTIADLAISGEAQIKGGAGLIEIESGAVQNLSLEIGAGKSEVCLKLTGNNAIKSGVGKLDLNLIGETDDYRLTVRKGVGSVTLNGEGLSDKMTYGTGATTVAIESGVGAVEIQTRKE